MQSVKFQCSKQCFFNYKRRGGTMNKQEIFDLINNNHDRVCPPPTTTFDNSANRSMWRKMIAMVCQLTAPEDISEEELLEKAAAAETEYYPSEPGEEDINYYVTSPFNGRRYNFSISYLCSGFPCGPQEM
jgi:hypothetical protein